MTRLSVVNGVISFDHANAEATAVGNTRLGAQAIYYKVVASGANFLSQSITITKNCAVIVFAHVNVATNTPGIVQIRRGGVNKTQEETITATNCCGEDRYGFLVYARELLPPGTYTYTVTNGDAGNISHYGCSMKIVAINPFER